jgi:UBX domain-containing protein 11
VTAARNIVSDPKDILDDDVTKHILKEFAAEIPPPPASVRSEKKISYKDENAMRLPPKQKSSVPAVGSENDLLTSMSARLRTVELTLKHQREELKEDKVII